MGYKNIGLSIMMTGALGLSSCGEANSVGQHRETRMPVVLPKHLPKDIRMEETDVVDVYYYDKVDNTFQQSSGIKVSPNIVVTAGHEFSSTHLRALGGGVLHFLCGDVRIFSPGDATTSASYAVSGDVSFSKSNASIVDMAVLRVNGDTAFASASDASVSGQDLKAGDEVFYVNYEPTMTGHIRNPDIAVVKSFQDTQPAIYGGVIVGEEDGKYIAATNIKSYGYGVPESVSRPGASGGPVYTPNGEVAGIVEAILPDGISKQQVATYYGVHIKNVDRNTRLQLEVIQPLTESEIVSRAIKLRHEDACG